ncbi:hypothetical protein GCM10010319_68270 [Streptomyces blastmyceticus]|uniref:Uncharacterized protein n=1 Tax=Streptomyces blastmyceticus TaxID=68180 RepID=A0ABN0Y1N6_9ACTN
MVRALLPYRARPVPRRGRQDRPAGLASHAPMNRRPGSVESGAGAVAVLRFQSPTLLSTELSGVDLAQQALVVAREAAKKNGGRCQEKPKRRTGPMVRRDGREPLGLGAAITLMMAERGMAALAAGGNVVARRQRRRIRIGSAIAQAVARQAQAVHALSRWASGHYRCTVSGAEAGSSRPGTRGSGRRQPWTASWARGIRFSGWGGAGGGSEVGEQEVPDLGVGHRPCAACCHLPFFE